MFLLLQTTSIHDIRTPLGLSALFKDLDSDRDGKISCDEFMAHFRSREVVSPLFETSLDGILFTSSRGILRQDNADASALKTLSMQLVELAKQAPPETLVIHVSPEMW